MNRQKGITALTLMQKSNRQLVKTFCDDLVKVIDAGIQTAHQTGFSEIEHELPINFNINGLDRQDAQTLIYSELIQIYLDKGFANDNIGIEFAKGGRVLFHIRWVNGMEETEREKRKKIIESHIWRGKGRN